MAAQGARANCSWGCAISSGPPRRQDLHAVHGSRRAVLAAGAAPAVPRGNQSAASVSSQVKIVRGKAAPSDLILGWTLCYDRFRRPSPHRRWKWSPPAPSAQSDHPARFSPIAATPRRSGRRAPLAAVETPLRGIIDAPSQRRRRGRPHNPYRRDSHSHFPAPLNSSGLPGRCSRERR